MKVMIATSNEPAMVMEEGLSQHEAEVEVASLQSKVGDNRVIYPLSDPDCKVWAEEE